MMFVLVLTAVAQEEDSEEIAVIKSKLFLGYNPFLFIFFQEEVVRLAEELPAAINLLKMADAISNENSDSNESE